MKTNTASPRLTSKAALVPILALLLGSLTACGGSASSTNSGGLNNNNGGGGTPLPAGTKLLYVGDNVGVIHGFGVDPDSGKPTPITPTQIPIPPVTNDSTVANR